MDIGGLASGSGLDGSDSSFDATKSDTTFIYHVIRAFTASIATRNDMTVARVAERALRSAAVARAKPLSGLIGDVLCMRFANATPLLRTPDTKMAKIAGTFLFDMRPS